MTTPSTLWIYANPHRFMRVSGALLPFLWGAAIVLLGYGLYLAFTAPPDYQQGDSVRIMYVHVPSAWMAMFAYSVLAGASAFALIYRHPLASVAGRAVAPIGMMFTLVTILTGALWAKPMWGAWWAWDPRLTSVLVMFFIYLAYIALWRMIEEPIIASRLAAIFALIGAVNLPIIKFSVDWWNSLHQPASVSRFAKPAIHPTLLEPLLWMGGGFLLLLLALLFWRMRVEILAQKLRVKLIEGL